MVISWKTFSITLVALVTLSTLSLAFNVQPVRSDYTWTQTICIHANGDIEPGTAPISTSDLVTYRLTDNIVGDVPENTAAIVVERDNIVLNGNGHTVQGSDRYGSVGLVLFSTVDVIVTRMQIRDFYYGIFVYGLDSSNNHIYNNVIAGNYYGIYFQNSGDNTIWRNRIASNNYGVYLESSSFNRICLNNFTSITNAVSTDPVNEWEDWSIGGNYWSDYIGPDEHSGENQNEDGPDGLGDTPYPIGSDCDWYPLMVQPFQLAGDLNGRGGVSILDAIILANHFGHVDGDGHEHGSWDWVACMNSDINGDGKVNILDAIKLASNLGH